MEEKNPETTDTQNDLPETKEAFDQAQMADISQEQPVEIDNQKMSETVEQKEAVEPEKEAIESSSPTTQHQNESAPKETKEIEPSEENKQLEENVQPVEQMIKEEEKNDIQIDTPNENKPSEDLISDPPDLEQNLEKVKPQEEAKHNEMFNGFKIPTNTHVGSHFLDEIMKESLNKGSPKAQDDTKVEEPQVHQEKELETVGNNEEILENQKVEDNKQDAQTEHKEKEHQEDEKGKHEELKVHLPEIQITQAPIQEDSSLKQLDKDENEEQNTDAEIEREDQEIRLKEQKTDLSDIEDFNLSQLQIKDHYFDDNLEEHLDKKISSAKKEFFEISESDRDLHQYGDMKDPEEDAAEPRQLLDNSELDKEAENRTESEAIEKEKETTEPKIEETKEKILPKIDEGSEVKDTENKNDQNSITNEDNKNLEALEKPANSDLKTDSNEVNNENQPQALITEEILKPEDKEAVEDLQKADLSSAAHSAVEQKSEVNPADIGHEDHKELEKQESQNTEEDEEELMLPAKPTHILPGEKEA